MARKYQLTQDGPEVQALLNKIGDLGNATEEKDGLMSAQDKEKLDGLPVEGGEGENSAQQIGSGARALGDSSFAENSGKASGLLSHAEGYSTEAIGSASHAEGNKTIAIGNYSHAEGVGGISNSGLTFSGSGTSYTTTTAHGFVVNTILKFRDIVAKVTSVPTTTSFTTDIPLSETAISDNTDLYIVAGTAIGESSHSEGDSTTAIGNQSHAEGLQTIASGNASHAEGSGTTASAHSAHAEGVSTEASGAQSHTEGSGTTASGNQSHAEGYFSKATGDRAHAEGHGTTASGTVSHAEGYNAVASGNYSHSEGNGTTASKAYAHAEGNRTLAGASASHTEGYSSETGGNAESNTKTAGGLTMAGAYAHAEGNATLAQGKASHSEGKLTFAKGDNSHAEGDETTASSAGSHAEGGSTTASGINSHAEGGSTKASGVDSHAEGIGTKANGHYSHTEGYNTIANGNQAHAEGSHTEANNPNEHAEGRYNKSNKASDTFGDAGNTAHSVGIGTSNARKNAFEIMQNGDAYLLGIGGYDGTNPGQASSLAEMLSQFVTKSVDDLANYYLKSETYTKAEVQALIGAIQHFHYEVYASLEDVTEPAANVLYLIGPTGSGSDKYEEYVYDSTKASPWVKIGDTSIDLSNYVTTDALNTALGSYVTSTALETALATKQNTLVSGSNIKTVNGNSILGGGNLKIEEPFIYVHGTTPFNDLETAHNAGRIIFAKYQGNLYVFGSREYTTIKPIPQITVTLTLYSFLRSVWKTDSNYLEEFRLSKATQTGQPDSISASKVTLTIPTKLSDLEADETHRVVTDTEKATWNGKYSKPSGGIPASDLAEGVIPDTSQFVTKSVDDLLNYYLKSETYTKAEVEALIGAISQFHYEIAASTSAVTNPANNVLYLIGPTGSGSDKYEEYVYPNSTQGWTKIGDTSIDLSGYVTTEALNTALASYVTSTALATILADYLPLAGGTMTGPITLARGDGKGLLFELTSNINVNGTSNTVFGFLSNGQLFVIGHPSYNLRLRGKLTRPHYLGVSMSGTAKEIALLEDIPSISTDIETDKNDNSKTASPKAVYDALPVAMTSAELDDLFDANWQ